LNKHNCVFLLGASSGIGAATAVHFSKLGYKLAICGRNVTALNEVVGQCLKTNNTLASSDVESVNSLRINFNLK
jgi:NADP-dependent 3-hydroxy acid dehydrogenase YdfG